MKEDASEEQRNLNELILSRFKGREGYFAVQEGTGFRPFPKSLAPDDLSRAYAAEKCCGFYLLDDKSHCVCSALDFDDHGKDSTAIQRALALASFMEREAGVTPLVEVSQSGTGAHVWVFHESLPAALIRKFWKAILDRADEKAEVYPKQDSLDGLEKSLGNLIRYPLFGESRFIDPEMRSRDAYEAISLAEVLTVAEVHRICDWWSEDQIVVSAPGHIVEGLPVRVSRLLDADPSSTLTVRWMGDSVGMNDASGSALALSIAVELVRGYVPTHEIEQALKWWGVKKNYAKAQRDDWVRRTVDKAYDMAVGRKVPSKAKTFQGMTHRYTDLVLAGNERVFRYGIKGLDESTSGGYAPSELTVITAKTSNGKTALALFTLDYAAACGHPGHLTSLEMSDRENARRIVSGISGNIGLAKTPEGNKQVHQAIDCHYATRAPLYFSDEYFHIDDIEREIRQHVDRHRIEVAVVDYMGLVDSNERDEYASQTKIVRRLKKLAKELDIAVVALVQLNRGESGADPLRPSLRHLRSSGAIENEADNVIAGVWPWKELPNKFEDKNDYRIHVLKCRNRGIITPEIKVYFDYEKQRFM